MQPTIEEYKLMLKGLPKEEKIHIIEQDLANIGLSRISIPPANNIIVSLPPKEKLEALKVEIEKNYEAYESETKRKELIPFMCDRNINWYFNKKNIPAQENLVLPTYEYFNEGPGIGLFEALDFLNLLEKQYKDLLININKPFDVLNNLRALPLNEREKQILYGFILKWFGGYPVNSVDEQCNIVLKLIEKEFLKYDKEDIDNNLFRADQEMRKKFMRLSISGTKAINTGMSWEMLYNAMGEKEPEKDKVYKNFDALFEAALQNEAIGPFENNELKLINICKRNFTFNLWLQETKEWEYGNEEQYNSFLTKDNFKEYLNYEADEKEQEIAKYEKNKETEKASWGIKPSSKIEDPFAIRWSSNNTIQFKNKEVDFPFDSIQLMQLLTELRKQFLDINVCPTDLQEFPQRVFKDTPLNDYPDLSAWIYNIIETWVLDVENKLHNGQKKRLFDGFLEVSKKLAASSKIKNNRDENTSENTVSKKIEDFLFPLKSIFNNEKEFDTAISLVSAFFSNQPINIQSPLFVKNGNIRNLAFVLGEIWRAQKNEIITYEYLEFYKQAFSIFKNQVLDNENLFGTNLYKYSLSKT